MRPQTFVSVLLLPDGVTCRVDPLCRDNDL